MTTGVRAANTAAESAATEVPDAGSLADELAAHLVSTVPRFTTCSDNVLRGEVTALTRVCVRWWLRHTRDDVVTDCGDLVRAAAGRWARHGIEIDVVLHAVHAGYQTALDWLNTRTGAAEPGGAVETDTKAIELLDLITTAVSKAYIGEVRASAAEHRTAVHTLASALLGGHATAQVARECGIAIAEEYFVLAVHLPPSRNEEHPHLGAQVNARHALRRVQAALADLLGNQAPAVLSVAGGTVLIPQKACADPDLDAMVERLSTLAAVPITAAVVLARTAAVPSAAEQAHELLDTAIRLGYGPGVHRFADLALHYQLTRPGAARDVLGAVLAPLDGHPELMETLRVFVATQLDRRRTARQLFVHPNTVDYRLKRIGQLTGHDMSMTRGMWYLRSALIARASGNAECSAHHPLHGGRRPA